MTPTKRLEVEDAAIEGLLAKLATALCDELTRSGSVVAREVRSVQLQAPDEERLVDAWLRTLFDAWKKEGTLFCRASVDVERSPAGELALKARLWGEPFDTQWHHRRYRGPHLGASQVQLRRIEDRWRATIQLQPQEVSVDGDRVQDRS